MRQNCEVFQSSNVRNFFKIIVARRVYRKFVFDPQVTGESKEFRKVRTGFRSSFGFILLFIYFRGTYDFVFQRFV